MPSHPSIFSKAAAAALFLLAAMAGPARAEVFNPETFTLDNGLQVVVVTNRAAPVISHMIWYRVGAADEARGHTGVAHFLEHMMFRGTETVADGAFSRLVSRNGGQDNAFTSWDYTAYFQNVARDRLALVMEMEADRMTNLRLDEQKVLTERAVIIEERRQRIDSQPAARLGEQVLAALYQNHPYGIPIIGWEQEMAALSLADVQSFYETWYAPNNAVLIVSGDIDAAELRPLAEQYYGPIPARPVPERVRPREPARAAERMVTLRDPDVQQPSWRRYYLARSYNTAPGREAYALQVLSEILGGDTTSRLYRSLVLDQQLATSAGTGYDPDGLDYAVFLTFLSPRPGVSFDDLEAAYEAEVARLLADGVTEAELSAARDRMVIQAIYARDSLGGPARILGSALASGQTIEDVEAWPERIAAVTAEDVLAAARLVLQPERSVTGLLLQADPTEEPIR